MKGLITVSIAVLLGAAAGARAQMSPPHEHPAQNPQDKAAMDHRGHQAMGWDQSKADHVFTSRPDGGVIEVIAKDPADAATIGSIRGHLKAIAVAFKDGNFEQPLYIHAQIPPGTAAMKERRGDLTYTYAETPRGGKVTISSKNREAIDAVHQFLAFQRGEHK